MAGAQEHTCLTVTSPVVPPAGPRGPQSRHFAVLAATVCLTATLAVKEHSRHSASSAIETLWASAGVARAPLTAPNVQTAPVHGSVTAMRASQTYGAVPHGVAHAPAAAVAETPAAPRVAGPEGSGASPNSFWFVLIAFGAGLWASKLMSWCRMGLFARTHAPEAGALAMFAASGEKSAVDALDSLFGDEPEPAPASAAPTRPVAVTYDDVLQDMSDFVMADATKQVALLQESRAPKWNRETARLNYSPVSMRELERVGLNAVSLGIMENEADLDTIKNYTAGVFVVFSIAAIAFGELGAQLFPGKNVGPTITYVLGAIPILFLSIGSVAPGLIVGLVSRIEDGKEGKGGNVDATGVNRRVRHEAAHFLVGWLLGLPIADYSVEDQTSLVEFHPTQNGELQPGQRLAKGEVDKMCVVALSGAVGEALHFDSAFGGGQDLQTLQRLFLMSEERINAQQQQDQTRWGALKARELLRMYDKEYAALCKAFAEKRPVKECIAILESS